MKKGIILLMLAMMLVGCANDPVETNQVSGVEMENIGASNQVEEVEKEMDVPELTENDRVILDDTIAMCTAGTSYEGGAYEYTYIHSNITNQIELRIDLAQDSKIMMEYFSTDYDGLEEKLNKSLVFEDIFMLVKDKLSTDVFRMVVWFSDSKTGDIIAFKVAGNE